MREIIHELESRESLKAPFVLATVIKTWGSAPRPVGAHMAVLPDGEMIGSVSGGCVENAVVDASQECLQSGQAQVLTFGVSDETAWEVGLACGGTIQVFLQRIEPDSELFRRLRQALHKRRTAVLVTLVDGPAAWLGRQLLIHPDGTVGAIDGNALDQRLMDSIRLSHPPREPHQTEIEGKTVFVEPLLPPARLMVIGGVHIAIPLTRMAKELDFEIYLIDPRPTFANSDRFPHLEHILNEWPDAAMERLGVDENTFVVTLSHDAKIDDPALVTALKYFPAYIGALGSKRTHEKRIARLLEMGFSRKEIERIHGPVGLDIKAKSPAEIALSILGEITAVRRASQ